MFKPYELAYMAVASFLLLASVWGISTERNMSALWERAYDNQVAAPGILVVGENQVGSVEQAVRNSSRDSGQIQDLIINDIEIGEGTQVKADSTVTFHYIGTTPSGREFAHSRRDGESITVTLGEEEIIAGLEQGMNGMREGGRRIIVVPPALGYGSEGTNFVASDATLVFAIELLSVE